MFKTLMATWPQDKDLPQRAYTLEMRNRVLDDTLYDKLPHAFYEERNGAGEYIPLRERRPSARMNLCRSVVEDSVSLLFSEAHFPAFQHADANTRAKLALLAKELSLNEVYLEAGLKGAVGSVAIFVRVLQNRVFVEARSTTYLTPTWDPKAPDTLLRVTEQYKVKGAQLKDAEFTGTFEDNADYWLRTVWDKNAETTYQPVEVGTENPTWTPDPDRTVEHKLGFVPVDWVKNLPGGDSIDGQPTFRSDAIDMQIEMDYLLSQNGRALKYSMDPTLVIKEAPMGQSKDTSGRPAPLGGAGQAIVVDQEGDAKLLEANGSSSQAVIEHLRMLRELALESLKGNRASAEKLATAQSGKALELLNQTLVWLADRLRIGYGEKSLRRVLQMVITMSQKVPGGLKFQDETEVGTLAAGPVTLVWPAWYAPTPTESQQRMETVARGVEAGIISWETAIRVIASEYDIEDLDAERFLVEAARIQREKTAAATKAPAKKEDA